MSKVKSFLPLMLYGVFYLLVFTYWMTFTSKASWILLLFMTLFLVVNSLMMFQSVKKIKIHPLNLSHIHLGENREVTVELVSKTKSKLFFPILIIKCNQLNLEKNYFLFFKQQKTISFEWQPKERMLLEILEFEITSSDFFNFITKKTNFKFETNILVLPAKIENVEKVMEVVYPNLRKTLFGEPTFNLEKISPYRTGDSIKKIDWKLSSKKQDLMVRDYEEYEENRLILVFYGRESKYFEDMLAVFFNLYQIYSSKDILFYIVGEGISGKEVALTGDAFSKIKASENPGELPDLPNHRIIIFTPRPTKLLDKALGRLNTSQKIDVIDYKKLKEMVDL